MKFVWHPFKQSTYPDSPNQTIQIGPKASSPKSGLPGPLITHYKLEDPFSLLTLLYSTVPVPVPILMPCMFTLAIATIAARLHEYRDSAAGQRNSLTPGLIQQTPMMNVTQQRPGGDAGEPEAPRPSLRPPPLDPPPTCATATALQELQGVPL